MRILPFLLSGIVTAGLVFALDRQLPVGGNKTPRLGYFLSPQQGFWQNAEAVDMDYNGDVKLNGLAGKVDVYVDDRLVPHVYAENDADAYYVQGYLHAKFRLWQMEFQTHVAAGRLSEIVGPERLGVDRFFRRLGMVYGAEQTMENADKNPALKAAIQSYSDGVNAYIQSLKPEQVPFEYKLLDYQPEAWTPKKTYLFMMFMAYDLAGRGAKNDLTMTNAKNYFGYVDFDKLFPAVPDSLDPIIPKGTVYAKPAIVPKEPAGIDSAYFSNSVTAGITDLPMVPDKDNGSNNWVVAGSKTKSGRPILCNDPHLGLNLPAIWFEMQIHTPTHNTYGASFPGSPAVIIGFNDSISWGVTNAGRDVLDYYELQFKDTTLSEYWFHNSWRKAQHREEVIKIKGQPDKVENIAMTVFGPLMYDNTYTSGGTEGKNIAVRWTAHDPTNGLQTFYQLNRAKNFDDYLAAISAWTCPGQNFVFASKTGDIAVKQQGAFIARWKRQGDFIMPGTDSAYMWQGIIPTEENPMDKNPARGFVSSGNQMATDASYPYYLGASNNFPVYRGVIINRLLAGMSNITPEDMQKLQMENYNVFAEMARPILLKNIDESALNKDEKKYADMLRTWNLKGSVGEKGATVFKIVWDSLESVIWSDEYSQSKLPLEWPEPSTLLESLLKDSVYQFADNISTKDKVETIQDAVMTAFKKATVALYGLEDKGRLDWDKYKDTKVSHLLTLPALSRLHLPIGGGTHMINATKSTHGPSWRMIVQMTDTIEAYSVYPGGQSGNPGSKFYDTFVDTWAAGKYYRIIFEQQEAISKNPRTKWHITFTNS